MAYMKEKDPQDGSVRWTYPKGFEVHTPTQKQHVGKTTIGQTGP